MSGIDVIWHSSVTFSNFLHELKSDFPTSVTDDGTVASKSDSHFENADPSIFVMDDGMVALFRAEHPEKVPSLITVVETGMLTSSKDEQLEKAYSPRDDRVEFSEKVTLFNEEQPENEKPPIVVTAEGIVISASLGQNRKVLSLISVSVAGSETCSKLTQ